MKRLQDIVTISLPHSEKQMLIFNEGCLEVLNNLSPQETSRIHEDGSNVDNHVVQEPFLNTSSCVSAF